MGLVFTVALDKRSSVLGPEFSSTLYGINAHVPKSARYLYDQGPDMPPVTLNVPSGGKRNSDPRELLSVSPVLPLQIKNNWAKDDQCAVPAHVGHSQAGCDAEVVNGHPSGEDKQGASLHHKASLLCSSKIPFSSLSLLSTAQRNRKEWLHYLSWLHPAREHSAAAGQFTLSLICACI